MKKNGEKAQRKDATNYKDLFYSKYIENAAYHNAFVSVYGIVEKQLKKKSTGGDREALTSIMNLFHGAIYESSTAFAYIKMRDELNEKISDC